MPNNILDGLLNSIHDAYGKVSEAKDARDSYLEPILTALGAKGGSVSHCSLEKGAVSIVRTGSCRGYRWDDDYTFPLEIFTCEDPIKAANEYVAEKKATKEHEERRAKLATIHRLQEELGTEALTKEKV